MRYLLVLFGILSMVSSIQAQQDYYSPRDVIYPYDESISVIRNVKVIDIVDGNIVIYKRNGESYEIKASSVYQDGVYKELKSIEITPHPIVTNNRMQFQQTSSDYLYDPEYQRYESLYTRARSAQSFGVTFTIIGFVGIVAGSLMITDESIYNDEGGALLYLGGFVFFHVGIPFWISGGVKKANNFKAMQRRKNKIFMSIVPSKYGKGIGVAINF